MLPARSNTLGHRNVQGLAVQPGTGRVYSVEQGTSVDDEVNLLTPGGNYGYRPDRLPGTYDESVPMTDPCECRERLRRCGVRVARRWLPPALPSPVELHGVPGTVRS